MNLPCGIIDTLSIFPRAMCANLYWRIIMANNANPAVPATSAVAQAVQTIGGISVAEAQQTLFTIGEETLAAELKMAEGKAELDVLDSNLHDWVKGLPYSEFMLARDFHKAGTIDKGKSDDAAQKIWERQINRIVSTFDFVRPKSQSKDAERKEKQKQETIEKLSVFGDGELMEKRDELLSKGDTKSINAAKVFARELERRNEGELKAEAANRKSMVETITKRVRELGKAGTADADALLAQVAAMLA